MLLCTLVKWTPSMPLFGQLMFGEITAYNMDTAATSVNIGPNIYFFGDIQEWRFLFSYGLQHHLSNAPSSVSFFTFETNGKSLWRHDPSHSSRRVATIQSTYSDMGLLGLYSLLPDMPKSFLLSCWIREQWWVISIGYTELQRDFFSPTERPYSFHR